MPMVLAAGCGTLQMRAVCAGLNSPFMIGYEVRYTKEDQSFLTAQ